MPVKTYTCWKCGRTWGVGIGAKDIICEACGAKEGHQDEDVPHGVSPKDFVAMVPVYNCQYCKQTIYKEDQYIPMAYKGGHLVPPNIIEDDVRRVLREDRKFTHQCNQAGLRIEGILVLRGFVKYTREEWDGR